MLDIQASGFSHDQKLNRSDRRSRSNSQTNTSTSFTSELTLLDDEVDALSCTTEDHYLHL